MRPPRFNAHQGLALLAFRHRYPALVEEIGRDPKSASVFADVAAITGEPEHVVRLECLKALRGVLRRGFKDAYEAMSWLQKKDWSLAVWCSAQIVRSLPIKNDRTRAYLEQEVSRIDGRPPSAEADVELPEFDPDEEPELSKEADLINELVYWFHREIECCGDEDRYGMLEVIVYASPVISRKHGAKDNIETHQKLLPVMADAVLGYPS